ncbi:hypothetical protein AcV7_007493 [Taiwanofungus camphoratus]|nr:hypothetical protein AcV7_007493 [Antrodia cinnamomea]
MSVCRALKPQPARPIGNRVRLATADTNQVAPPASQCRRPLGGFVASSCSPHALSTGSSHDTGALRIDTLLARIRRGDTVSWLAQHVSDARTWGRRDGISLRKIFMTSREIDQEK